MTTRIECWRCGVGYVSGLPCCPPPFGCGAKRLKTMERVTDVEQLLAQLESTLHRLQNTAKAESLHGAEVQAGFAVRECQQIKETIEVLRMAIKNSMRSAA